MAKKKSSADVVLMTLRYPRVLRDGLNKIAERERRSLNEQITYVLERWLEQQHLPEN